MEKLSLLLLRCAADRWRDDGQMLAEWRAELYTMDRAKDRLGYALSLAVSPPHRARTSSVRRLPAVVASLLLLLALPIGYQSIAGRWRAYLSPDMVPWQVLSAAAAIAGAVALGVGSARLTVGLTRAIKPMLLSSWVFGVPFLLYLSLAGLAANRAAGVVDLCAGLAGAIACGIVVVRLTVHGHTAIAWGFVAVAAPVVLLLSGLHGIIGFFNGTYLLSVHDPVFASTVFALANQPFLHLTCFGFAYTRSLAAKYR